MAPKKGRPSAASKLCPPPGTYGSLSRGGESQHFLAPVLGRPLDALPATRLVAPVVQQEVSQISDGEVREPEKKKQKSPKVRFFPTSL